jgi:hypothetical protein
MPEFIEAIARVAFRKYAKVEAPFEDKIGSCAESLCRVLETHRGQAQ